MQINTQDWTKCKFITVFKIDNVYHKTLEGVEFLEGVGHTIRLF